MKLGMFSEFKSPPSTPPHTFNKSCRFISPSLSKSGIHTRGHLWKLANWVIDTSDWPPRGRWVNDRQGKLHWTQRKQLAYLAEWLDKNGYGMISNSIEAYLDHDASLAGLHDSELLFVDRYMSGTAEAVADAIEKGG